jgi:dethiobiotin synthetase
MHAFVVTGTDTGIGKTVFSAALTQALGGSYFKPVQAGLDGPTDTETAKALSGLPDAHFVPEAYRLNTPASPHLAAEIDGVAIDPAALDPSRNAGDGHPLPLIVEGAGGLMVPLTRGALTIDVMAAWGLPVVLCARTELGTINHTLLSIEALRRRSMEIHGVAFIGDAVADSERTICEMAGVRRLGRLPWVEDLSPAALAGAFARNFDATDFGGTP